MKSVVQKIWELGFEAGEAKESLRAAEKTLTNLEAAHTEAVSRVNAEFQSLKNNAREQIEELRDFIAEREVTLTLNAEGVFLHLPGSVLDLAHRRDTGRGMKREDLEREMGKPMDAATKDRFEAATMWLQLNGLRGEKENG